MRKIATALALLLALAGSALAQGPVSITDTKHNLSASALPADRTVKAASEMQICVFCHTPHGSLQTVAPLWNRTATAETYTPYTSDYLKSLQYPGSDPAYPLYPPALKPRSRLCMSCHDGTVALGSVWNLPGQLGQGTIAMTGTTLEGKMPPTATGFLGTNLTDDHPVGFAYDTVKDPELVSTRPWPWTTAVKLDPNTSSGTVECQSCHDPHNNQFTKFLRRDNTNAALCTECHNKNLYADSIHRTSTQAYTPPGRPATTVGENSCRNCHKAHSSGSTMYILRAVEQNTCFESGCHGTLNPGVNTTPAGNNIQADMAKIRRHPTTDFDGLHKNISGGESATQLGSSNRHAECQDCHNPHQAKPAVVPKSGRAAAGIVGISDALRGTWGVKPNPWPTPRFDMLNNNVAFETPTAYMRVSGADLTDEYQVCLKCHSNYVDLPIVPPNTQPRNIAIEINPGNSSYHGIVPGGTTNLNVTATTINEPWATNKRVWCSDCHGRENTTSSVPYGPHGSSNTGTGPGSFNSDKMLVATIATNTASGGTPLCLVCHKSTSYLTGNTGSNNDRHGADAGYSRAPQGCFSCHMWSNAALGGDGKIYPHGMNARWYTIYGGASGSGTRQMVNAFNGGWYTNMDYPNRRCWTTNSSGALPSGSPCNSHTNQGYNPGK